MNKNTHSLSNNIPFDVPLYAITNIPMTSIFPFPRCPLLVARCSLLFVVVSIFVLKVVVVSGGVLILLVLGHEVVHIALGLGELHFVHSLSSVPVEECFAAEHGGELLAHSFEHILNGGGVPDEGGAHLEPSWRYIADRGL